ncbi:MAG: PD40 domain-containing protein [Armatimonadetes bacterium]|nr:PD40 domain-containing protein [Armatimonadota bacterium]MDE2207571.1 PD40 domain-containing protein [Armatimonadota bacterium]
MPEHVWRVQDTISADWVAGRGILCFDNTFGGFAVAPSGVNEVWGEAQWDTPASSRPQVAGSLFANLRRDLHLGARWAAVSPSGLLLAFGSDVGPTFITDMDGNLVSRFDTALSAAGAWLSNTELATLDITQAGDWSASVWRPKQQRPVRRISMSPDRNLVHGTFTDAVALPGGRLRTVMCTPDRTVIRIIDWPLNRGGRPLLVRTLQTAWSTSADQARISPDGQRLAYVVTRWDTGLASQVHAQIARRPDSRLTAHASRFRLISRCYLALVQSGQQREFVATTGAWTCEWCPALTGLCWSPDGHQLGMLPGGVSGGGEFCTYRVN